MSTAIGTGEHHRGKQDGQNQSRDEPRCATAFLLGWLLRRDAITRCGRRRHLHTRRLIGLPGCYLILGSTSGLLRGLKLGTLQYSSQLGHITGLLPIRHTSGPHFALGCDALLSQFFNGKRTFLFSVSNQVKFHSFSLFIVSLTFNFAYR